jgi:hypothetical protein
VRLYPRDAPCNKLCLAGFGRLTAHHWGNLGPQQFDGLGYFLKRLAPDVNLPDEALMSKQLVLIQQFVDDLLAAADEERLFFSGFLLIFGAAEHHALHPVSA